MSISDADRQVLDQLAAHGDNPAIPRPVMHFFYGQPKQLSAAAESFKRLAWKEAEVAQGSLTATIVTDLQEASVTRMVEECERVRTEFSLEYDGWETSVEET